MSRMREEIANLKKTEEVAKAGGGPKKIEEQHAKGKLTLRAMATDTGGASAVVEQQFMAK